MINITKNYALIRICKVIIPINIKQYKQFFKKKFLANNDNIILLWLEIMISLI